MLFDISLIAYFMRPSSYLIYPCLLFMSIFAVKSSKKTASSVGGGVVKAGSMFASTDAVDGKVGVVNSGKGLTDFAQRKKHKF
jgi:hypothetical protein